MSRTYRRKGVKPKWLDFDDVQNGQLTKYGITKWRYHSDCPDWSAPWSQMLKTETSRSRRNDDRTQLAALKKINDIEDFDFIEYEKEYLGYVWNYD